MTGSFFGILSDIFDGLRRPGIWWRFGWLDIKMRYRRTILGPFWMTFSYAVSVAALGTVFSTLFKMEIHDFLPYLAGGLAAWTLISTLITDSGAVFVSAEQLILQNRIPMSIHVYRMVVRNVLVYFHNLVVAVAVAMFFDVRYGVEVLLIVPAILLACINAVWVGLLLGTACARYRDLPHIITLLVSVSFFVTPIFWTYDMLGWRSFLADFNPLYHFVELLRAPLIGKYAAPLSWQVAIGGTIVGWLFTLLFAVRYQRRVPYWL